MDLDSARSQSFGYDALYRLTNANGIYGTIDFTYDKAGNRTTRVRTGAAASDDSYFYVPGTNLLQAVVGTHPELIAYDADGNTTTRTPGAANPVPAITDPADYTYNSGGQRAVKDATSDKIFHYDLAGQLIAETDGLGNLIKAYVWLHGQPLAQIAADGSVTYYHNDHLGTPQKMTDSSAAVVWAADYLPFGQADVIVGTVENNLRFAGQYFDSETGLHYNYHRYYDPSLGRYLRADPIGLAGGVNPYLYTSNPINLIDPYGLYGLGAAYGGGFTGFGHRLSFHLEFRVVHDSSKRFLDLSAYSFGLTTTMSWIDPDDPDCKGEAEGFEFDWGPDILFTNADNIDDVLEHSLVGIGISAGVIQGYDFELSHMTDSQGNLTGVWEVSSAIPVVPFPYAMNLGAEYHVGAEAFTLDTPIIFGRREKK